MGGDIFRALMGEALARKQSLDPECLHLFIGPAAELADRMSYGPFIEASFGWFGFLKLGAVLADGAEHFSDFAEESEVWHSLYGAICGQYGGTEPSLNVLLQELDLMPKQAPSPPHAVRCYTIHTAKGMEFDHVYLIGMAEDILPSYQSLKHGILSNELEEERRSCFVAITRTKYSLTLTRSKSYFGYEKQPSRFLNEMDLSTGTAP